MPRSAGPGFINIRLKPVVYENVLIAILEQGGDFGRARVSAEGKVNVEYVWANPTGPMHVGHARGAVFGDALANLLAFAGREATREYYVNDAGAQVDVLARSAFLRYREALGETVTIPAGLYPGDYLKPVGEALAARVRRVSARQAGSGLAAAGARVRDRGDDGDDPRRSRRAQHCARGLLFRARAHRRRRRADQVRAAIEDLRRRGIVYEGRLPPPKGQPSDDWEDREQTLFRTTDFGDDVDRPLNKSDGGYTYFASDIAYHQTSSTAASSA